MIPALEHTLRRDRLLVVVCIVMITMLAWLDLIRRGAGIKSMAMDADAMRGMDTTAWGVDEWLGLSAMWAVMMVGMMLPSAAPVARPSLTLVGKSSPFANGLWPLAPCA